MLVQVCDLAKEDTKLLRCLDGVAQGKLLCTALEKAEGKHKLRSVQNEQARAF